MTIPQLKEFLATLLASGQGNLISGEELRQAFNVVIDTLSDTSDVALITQESVPLPESGNIVYIATEDGDYRYFGGLKVSNEIAFITESMPNVWHKQSYPIPAQIKHVEVENATTPDGKIPTADAEIEGNTLKITLYDIKGEKGARGPANTLCVGTVTGGEQAGASIIGESPKQVLNLVLPKGEKGEKGDAGNDGHNPNLGTYKLVSGDITPTPPTPTEDGDYIVVIDDSDPSDVTSEIYKYNGSAWQTTGREANGTQFQTGEFVGAIDLDDKLEENSNNIVKSKGIAKVIGIKENNSSKFVYTLLDELSNILLYVSKNYELASLIPIIADSINTKVINGIKIENNNHKNIALAFVDSNDNLIFGVDKYDKIIGLEKSKKDEKSAVYRRNEEMVSILLNDAMYDYNYAVNGDEERFQKRFQALIQTDSHLMSEQFENTIDMANDCDSVDCVIHLGDFCYFVGENDNISNIGSCIEKSKKPLYLIPGNHDIGTRAQYVAYVKDDVQVFEQFVKPLAEKGWLKSNEYDNEWVSINVSNRLPKCYYYHDFENYKIRFIFLYPYEDGNVFDETYWQAIDYDEDNPNIAIGNYSQNDTVNVPGYTTHSFKATQNINITNTKSSHGSDDGSVFFTEYWEKQDNDDSTKPFLTNKVYNANDYARIYVDDGKGIYHYEVYKCKKKITVIDCELIDDDTEKPNGIFKGPMYFNPKFKALRCMSWYSKKQLEWLCELLDDAGQKDYTCVICQHHTFLNNVEPHLIASNDPNTRFSTDRLSRAEMEVRYHDNDKNIISQIVASYQTNSPINRTIEIVQTDSYNPSYKSSVPVGGKDDVSGIPCDGKVGGVGYIDLNYTFDVNENEKKVLFLNGHNHADYIRRSNEGVYSKQQTNIAFISGTLYEVRIKDEGTMRANSDDTKSKDTMTAITIYDDKVHLSRIGNNVTCRIGNDNRLIKIDNEVITF